MAGAQATLSNPRLVQVVQVAEAVGVSNKLNDGRKDMSLEDIPYGHVVVVESISSVAGHCPTPMNCSTASSHSSQLRHILVGYLLMV